LRSSACAQVLAAKARMAVVMMSERRTMVPPDLTFLGHSDLHNSANIAITPYGRLARERV
jgi:hypothetical protein